MEQGIHLGKTAVVRQEMVRIIKYGMIMSEMWGGPGLNNDTIPQDGVIHGAVRYPEMAGSGYIRIGVTEPNLGVMAGSIPVPSS